MPLSKQQLVPDSVPLESVSLYHCTGTFWESPRSQSLWLPLMEGTPQSNPYLWGGGSRRVNWFPHLPGPPPASAGALRTTKCRWSRPGPVPRGRPLADERGSAQVPACPAGTHQFPLDSRPSPEALRQCVQTGALLLAGERLFPGPNQAALRLEAREA